MLLDTFFSLCLEIVPGKRRDRFRRLALGRDYLFRPEGMSPQGGFAGLGRTSAGSRDSGLPRALARPRRPALLLNHPAARAAQTGRAPPSPRECPGPATGERGARLRRLCCEIQPPPRQCAGANATAVVRKEVAQRSRARTLRGPEEVCWPRPKHAAAPPGTLAPFEQTGVEVKPAAYRLLREERREGQSVRLSGQVSWWTGPVTGASEAESDTDWREGGED